MNKIKRIFAALFAACLLCVPMAAVDTECDWYDRIGTYMTSDEDKLYDRLVSEAGKGDVGMLADVTRGSNLKSQFGRTAYGIEVFRISGSISFTAPAGDDIREAALNAVNADCGERESAAKKRVMSAYIAFVSDHPEAFWLSGECMVMTLLSYSYSSGGTVTYTATGYFVLQDTDGAGNITFDIRLPEYRSVSVIRGDIAVRDAAIDEILSLPAVKSAVSVRDKADALNDALTARNCYYSGDPSGAPQYSRYCLSALVGSVGGKGPVCSGYATAFKVLCDRLGIPCVTVRGDAISSSSTTPEAHMWNAVKIGGAWYAVDVTWNDPTVSGVTSAVSGFERDDYFLVGSDTTVDGRSFAASHIQTSELSPSTYAAAYLPTLSRNAYTDADAALPFTDVSTSDSFYNDIVYVYEKGLMNGVSATEFAPSGNLTRAMIVTVLWRMVGSPEVGTSSQFTDVPADEWYTDAVAWAAQKGIVGGYGNGLFGTLDDVTREQALAIFCRYADAYGIASAAEANAPGYSYSSWARASVRRASAMGMLPEERDLTASATRGEVARMLNGFMSAVGN